MSVASNCPNCGLLNPSETRLCDCGYDFATGRKPEVPDLSLMDVLFSFDGRITRSTYWVRGILPMTGATAAALFLVMAGVWVLAAPFAPLLMWAGYALNAKRWHDRDKSGWWSLIVLVPYIGALWALVELGFLAGTSGPNRYGPQPTK